MSLESLLEKNNELFKELLEGDVLNKSPRLKETSFKTPDVKKYLDLRITGNRNEATQLFSGIDEFVVEAVIKEINRPAILIKDDKFEQPLAEFWINRLEPNRATIEKIIPSVGRIEVKNHPRGFAYLGTGWLVDENIIVTNRHVAREFATFDNGNFIFASNPITNRIIKPHIDFVEEYRDPDEAEINIDDILYIDSDLDIAFLKLKGGNAAVRPIIPLASTPPDSGCEVAVIGYPAADSHRNPLEPAKMRKIFADIYDVKRLQPGTITAVIDGQPIFHHDCSTLGGNSGSPVLNIKTGEAVGLHFAGDFKKQNYAISASIVKQKLEALQAGTLEIVSLDQTPLIIFPSPVDVEEVDNETPIEFEDIPCLCPLDVQSLENSSLEGPFSAVNTQLPKRGTGYYSYARYRDKQFGLPETIQAIEAIGEAWFQNHRRGPLIGIGNISVEGGGPVPPHKSHQKGLDIDFRPLRKDGARVAVTFKSASYSRSRTQELVNTILTNPVLSVELIFFNDRKVKGVQHWPGHDNHLHVRFTK